MVDLRWVWVLNTRPLRPFTMHRTQRQLMIIKFKPFHLATEYSSGAKQQDSNRSVLLYPQCISQCVCALCLMCVFSVLLSNENEEMRCINICCSVVWLMDIFGRISYSYVGSFSFGFLIWGFFFQPCWNYFRFNHPLNYSSLNYSFLLWNYCSTFYLSLQDSTGNLCIVALYTLTLARWCIHTYA